MYNNLKQYLNKKLNSNLPNNVKGRDYKFIKSIKFNQRCLMHCTINHEYKGVAISRPVSLINAFNNYANKQILTIDNHVEAINHMLHDNRAYY